MEDERDFNSHSPSLKHKLQSTLCFSSCFGNGQHERLEEVDKPSLVRASSSEWPRSSANGFPEFKEKFRNLISRIGRGRRHSGDFTYDPLSYALNFDEGPEDDHTEELPLRNFSSRLPVSPPKSVSSPVVVS